MLLGRVNVEVCRDGEGSLNLSLAEHLAVVVAEGQWGIAEGRAWPAA